jgi:multisubunit Na+/H+ antiporter MnhE subunit
MISLVINLVISVIWMLLDREMSVLGFAIGFVIGFAMIWLFQPVLQSRNYVRRVLGAVRFIAIFSRAFLASCWSIGRAALFGSIDSLEPRLISYDVRGLSRFEIFLLSHCISLTPGTTTVDISDDLSTFILHVLDTNDPDEVRRDIDKTFRQGILAFTR